MVKIERVNNRVVIECEDELKAREIEGECKLIQDAIYIPGTKIRSEGDFGISKIAMRLKDSLQGF